ncbi:insulysin, insulin-degrading enzyme (macronuclear) [Tetrahymena thermophila SB210]|uniref:Insulysin, insulin-degrading enzyme n=1 Tax=Tetrahymena thermophila (strain SB210) TaxID=312017 RepID=I7MIE6_TETTS|nr:insulysin, insulin-degrading enzyme [Tetrahymena thermophila SB210]EAS04318.1 insulysin, insulin-degrading enzyme [Tetrahymena thermophila SB210]|eukprot:XP_001024563.1 insulysin, insulin-degrading enzyme [Tetrahymena thermophila SB210]
MNIEECKYEVVTDTIVKPQNDEKKYKYIRLKKNKLEIVFVQDFHEGKSAAAANVNAGCLQDPLHRQGLAHFLEHMLFLGTEKYPQADFDQFLNENSGTSNAYTDYMQTNYYFECSDNAFREALDRFGHFFINPLFNQDLVDREMNAVNSEHSKNLQDDEFRKLQLLDSSALKHSPLNKFGTGNLETLKHDSIRDDLIAFYKENYSANLIKMCIYTHENIEDIESYVVDLFEQIPNFDKPAPTYLEKPFPNQIFQSFWKYVPAKNHHNIKVMWTSEFFTKESYQKHPLKYWSHVFGFEGENSLLSALKHLGLAEGLASGYEDIMNNMSIFYVDVELTQQGLSRYTEVLNIVFTYLQIMKKIGVQDYIYEEDRITGIQEFNSAEQEESMDFAHSLTANMQIYKPKDIIKAQCYFEEYDPQLINQVINSFKHENMRIFFSSQTLESECTQVDPYYFCKYQQSPLPQNIIDLFINPTYNHTTCGGKQLGLPPKNDFIAKDLSLITQDYENLPKYPSVIKQDEKSIAYFKQDHKFKVPKTLAKVIIYSNDGNVKENVENYLLYQIWMKLFQEENREFMYQAEMAKIYTKMYIKGTAEIEFEGFSETLPSYLNAFFERLSKFDPTPYKQDFLVEYEKLSKKLQNFFCKNPYKQGKYYNQFAIRHKGLFGPQELLEAIKGVTYEKICQFHNVLFKNIYLTWFITGNLTSNSALNVINSVEKILYTNRTPLPKNKIDVPQAIDITNEDGLDYVWEINLDDSETNSYISSIFQFENSSIKNDVLMKLIDNFLEEPFYTSLRTEQQLGYIVWSMTCAERTVIYVYFQIQSDVKPPQYLSQQIEAFVDEMLEEVSEMKDEDLDIIKESVENDLREQPHSISQEALRFWQEIQGRRLVFDSREKQIEELQKITLEQFKEAFTSIFRDNRANIQIHLVSKVHREENEKLKPSEDMDEESNQLFIESIEQFKINQPKHKFKYY